MSEYLDRALSPAHLGKLQLRNRLIKAATFEGKTPGAVPGQALRDFHMSFAEGGIGMTTIAYCTTEADGRINENMMYMHEGIKPALGGLIDELHAAGARVSGQMAHCGYFSKNKELQRLKRPLGPSARFNPLGVGAGMPFAGAMTLADIDYLVQTYSDAARLMKDMGFDAIEIHFGHGYGLSQFISPLTNKRTDEYGGSLENRMRLPLRALAAVREAVGEDFPILGKMGLTDGVRGGLHEDEAVEVAVALDQGGIDALITSGGTSSFNVMKMFRGPSIHHGLIEQEKSWIMRTGLKLMGPKMFRQYPYEELYFREGAMRVRDRVNCQMVYIGGCSTAESLDQLMRDGFDFVQMGRPLIKNPSFANDARAALDAGKTNYNSGCIHCNRCVSLIDAPGGVRCPLNEDAEAQFA